jgi:hypothetical protein
LKLAIQGLISYLGETDDISENLENLSKRGLDEKIRVALQRVRMTGEGAVQPGVIDSGDGEETARALFGILNLIVDALMVQPRRVDEMLGKLPQE